MTRSTGKRSSSIAAGVDTFAHGFLEAGLFLERDPESPVLLVVADEPVPPLFTALVGDPEASYAVALLLGTDGGPALRFELETADGEGTPLKWPDAVEFVRWWVSEDPRLELTRAERRWVWTREPRPAPR